MFLFYDQVKCAIIYMTSQNSMVADLKLVWTMLTEL